MIVVFFLTSVYVRFSSIFHFARDGWAGFGRKRDGLVRVVFFFMLNSAGVDGLWIGMIHVE